ncbi:MAG: acetylxylan esterase [Euryarchaeota archaeon]|nr:acetylxylan esterase [Euryarchaeota archaeon]
MMKRLLIAVMLMSVVLTAIFSSGCVTRDGWRVTNEGLLEYGNPECNYQLKTLETMGNHTLHEVVFTSRDKQIAGLLRIPGGDEEVPGVVLLPGATVTKEGEQGLAKYLCGLGYASIAIDQRNLGGIDVQSDLRLFLNDEEPTEHKMVHDALVAAEVLRKQPGIDPERIVYLGESNGARFAITACALDPNARGMIAISTCGYDLESAIATGQLNDRDMIRFYRSIDPDTYLTGIQPRKFVMIHSLNDTIIQYDSAQRTYTRAVAPKELYTVGTATHGYCTEMDEYIKTELAGMVS